MYILCRNERVSTVFQEVVQIKVVRFLLLLYSFSFYRLEWSSNSLYGLKK